ncbi:TPA: hypothetical protein NJ344_004804 [Vibrio parahaemolyticus]|uniref:hypothetical protein n=1 Tax=Vibrio parahaemolyticus TaxID=670 RepID=UPI0006A64509|nr:hypothetical protein [Vibrio parahaemolyticus]EHR7861289.1 hypothetical protein [Vibrio parahaemolyticus]EJC6932458.1 hypothetical protein [Vibrio parahaemolyticus]ELA9426043.1 hypothetical protein [Vibrio parahaemolyticus]KOE91564.1 hypothetical protein ACS91_02555 [Vibrio parahaemolyticus]MBE4313938.1 hypothetical protein [Vibrio parahaemolyticus]
MEPWSSFATILGLISAYKAEGRARDGDDYNELMKWLSEKRHKTLIEELNNNQILSMQVKQLLNRNHDELMDSLANLDKLVMQLASQLDGFKGIVNAIEPTAQLSEQAVDILRQFDCSGASKFLEVNTQAGSSYMFLDGQGNLNINEPRFVHDDLTQLIKLGLLELDFNKQGGRIFKITRLMVSYLANAKS